MIRMWVIPYSQIFIQAQMEAGEAQQILDELVGIEEAGEGLKLIEFKQQLEEMVKKAKTYEKKNKKNKKK